MESVCGFSESVVRHLLLISGTLTSAEIRRMGSMLTGAELNSMRIIWADYLKLPEQMGQPTLNAPIPDSSLAKQFLQTTMGVSSQVSMSTDALYQQMGAIKADGFIGLPNMNYSTPVNGWYAYEASGLVQATLFTSQVEANKQRQSGQVILNADFKPLNLRWHQLCAIHRFLEHVSSPLSPTPLAKHQAHGRPGLLISDEVGIGKTAQALGMISQIIHWASLMHEHAPLPHIHGEMNQYEPFIC